jgi:hypothetical protein
MAEILSQPQCGTDSMKQVEGGGVIRKIGKRFSNTPEWIFVGYGSSYCVCPCGYGKLNRNYRDERSCGAGF